MRTYTALPYTELTVATGNFDGSRTPIDKIVLHTMVGTWQAPGSSTDGWIADSNTWTYASADSPTFTITVAGVDLTSSIGVGDKIKLTQTTAKYFIVTAIAFSTDTTITVYGGTDYTLANAAITSPYYSHSKTPFGFPTAQSKWTVRVTDTGGQTTSTPTANTWYNTGTISISLPIGAWQVTWQATLQVDKSATTVIDLYGTLSTANNSQSDADLSTFMYLAVASGTLSHFFPAQKRKNIAVASKTSYYLNISTTQSGVATIGIRGDKATTIIEAVCVYL